MSIAIISGAAGLIGSEAAEYFSNLGMQVLGIDNNMRERFFGEDASTNWQRDQLLKNLNNYTHYDEDIRDFEFSALKGAAEYGQLDVVKYFFEKGLTTDDIRSYNKPLKRAAKNG
ncbi:MAG: hypothetical protein N2D54_03295, partial [Chloroflexota bacterium]